MTTKPVGSLSDLLRTFCDLGGMMKRTRSSPPLILAFKAWDSSTWLRWGEDGQKTKRQGRLRDPVCHSSSPRSTHMGVGGSGGGRELMVKVSSLSSLELLGDSGYSGDKWGEIPKTWKRGVVKQGEVRSLHVQSYISTEVRPSLCLPSRTSVQNSGSTQPNTWLHSILHNTHTQTFNIHPI